MSKKSTIIITISIIFVAVAIAATYLVNNIKSKAILSIKETYLDYFLENNQVAKLVDDKSEITDEEMASFALLSLSNQDNKNGNTKEEYNAITEKYFGKKITNFNTKYTRMIPETDKVISSGSITKTSPYFILHTIKQNGNIKTARFNCFFVDDKNQNATEIKKDLLANNFEKYQSKYSNTEIEMTYEELKDKNGKMHIKYQTVTSIPKSVKSDYMRIKAKNDSATVDALCENNIVHFNGVKVTVTDFKKSDKKAPEGKQYVVFNVKINNLTEESILVNGEDFGVAVDSVGTKEKPIKDGSFDNVKIDKEFTGSLTYLVSTKSSYVNVKWAPSYSASMPLLEIDLKNIK